LFRDLTFRVSTLLEQILFRIAAVAAKSNQKSDSNDAQQATTPEFPDDVMAVITDLLTRQQQWQQQQSKSEELIARMADQLEQSQRVIQSLAAGDKPAAAHASNSHREPVAAKTAEPGSPAKSPADDSTMSWEKQKAFFMNGHSNDAAHKPAAKETSPTIVLPPPVTKQPVAEPVVESICPRGLSLEARIEHEMGLLENCDQADRIRWLRERLEDRLRESEIEISIERARIGREKRELELARAEFEEEVHRMREEESSNSKRFRKDGKDRWSKFLGR
jgi:hypothetical protein